MLKKSAVLAGVCLGFCVAVVLSFAPLADASRNSSGTYSLPAGNPVTTGTTITSTWANSTLSDISTELTSSLDRNGKGSMLAALKLYGGTLAAPGLSFSSETGSGLFRNGAGDLRFGVSGVNVQRWASTGSTFPLALVVQDGATFTRASSNSNGLTSTGNGSGSGVDTWGGATGAGVSAHGGATSGNGITAAGGGTSGSGGYFTGGTPDGVGITALASGTGWGANITGGTIGVYGTGGAGSAGGSFGNGTAATGATRQTALTVRNGDISLDSVAAPASTTAVKNALTPTNLIKAWATISDGSASPSVTVGFNVSSVSCSGNAITVNLAQSFSGNYLVMANSAVPYACGECGVLSSGVSSFTLGCYDHAGSVINLCATACAPRFMAIGAQ